jgi:hypothetical protein
MVKMVFFSAEVNHANPQKLELTLNSPADAISAIANPKAESFNSMAK